MGGLVAVCKAKFTQNGDREYDGEFFIVPRYHRYIRRLPKVMDEKKVRPLAMEEQ